MSQLIERLREAHDNFAGLEGVSNDDLVAVLDAAAALTQPPSPVAAEGYVLVPVEPTERMCSEGESAASFGIGKASSDEDIKYVYRAMLSARPPIGETVPGAGWQDISTAPKDGDAIAVWIEGTPACRGHVFSPVSITEEGDWWDDSTGDQIEPIIGATYWMRPAPPLAPPQEGEAP